MLSDFEAAPFGDGPSLPAVLANAADGGASQALVATAWLRRAGLAAVHAPLTAIAGCGGPVRLLVGCEFGGTTRDAVTDAVQFGADVRVFHDIDPRKTFHPKVYLAWNLRTAWLFVGSNNLTPGGVQDNYEAGLSLRCPADAKAIWQVRDWFERMSAAPGRAVPVTPDLLAALPTEQQVANRRRRQRPASRSAGGTGGPGGLFSAPPWPQLPPSPDQTGTGSASGAETGAGSGGGQAGATAPPAADQSAHGRGEGAGFGTGTRSGVGAGAGVPERLSRMCPPKLPQVSRAPETRRLWESLHDRLIGLDPDLGWRYAAARRAYYWPEADQDHLLWFLSGATDQVVVNVYGYAHWEDIRLEQHLPKPTTRYVPVAVRSLNELDHWVDVLDRIYRRLRFGEGAPAGAR